MRAVLGPAIVHGALMAAGLGVLRALGVIPSLWSRRALAAAGLAYLLGTAATLTVCVVVLVLGGPFTLVSFGIVAAVLAVPLALDMRRWRRPARVELRVSLSGLGGDPARWAVILTLAAFAALAVVGLLTLGNRPIAANDVDAWHIWATKALLLFESPHLPTAIFGFSGDVRFEPHYNINPSYPLLLPLLEALHMRALGRPDPSSVHIVMWLLGIMFVWAGGFIASRVTSAIVWAPVLAGAMLLSLGRLLSGYADLPLGLYLGLGTLQLGVWLQSGRRRDLAVAVLLLAGAAGMKNEGTSGALVILAVALAVTVMAQRRHAAARRRQAAPQVMLAVTGLVVVAILPWRLWVAAHHLQSEEPLARIANPGFLAGHLGRVGPALRALEEQIGMTSGVTVFVAIALALVVACLWERRGRTIAAFYLATLAGYFVTLVWSFWINTLSLTFLLPVTAPRLVLALSFIAVAAVLHLSGPRPGLPGLRRGREAAPPPPEAELSPLGAGAGRRSA
jgi:hypothetical protein